MEKSRKTRQLKGRQQMKYFSLLLLTMQGQSTMQGIHQAMGLK